MRSMGHSVLLGCLAALSLCYASVLPNFQVAQPPDLRDLTLLCSRDLVHHTFGNSFGKPARVDYEPPGECGDGTTWQAIVLNITATSNGTQYDRLSTLYLSHIEILRTSTAEPTRDGIIWTVLKDVTRYAPLFAQPGPLLLDLGNLLLPERNLTGEFGIKLSVSFFGGRARSPASVSLSALSSLSLEQANYFETSGAVELLVPKNAIEAYIEVYAAGNALEEFWYSNAPDSTLPHLPADAGILGKGPYREIQLLIDGRLAGIVLPFPVIYTGGIIPTAWRPIAAYGAFDAPTTALDVTPFLPLLCDDALHTFELRVISGEQDGAVNANWWISGNLCIVHGNSSTRTRGKLVRHDARQKPSISSVSKIDGKTGIVEIETKTERQMRIEALVQPGDQHERLVVLDQHLTYINKQWYSRDGLAQTVSQSIVGSTRSTHDNLLVLSDAHSYTLWTDTAYTPRIRTFDANITQTFSRTHFLPPSFSTRAHRIATAQHANGSITLNEIGRVETGRGETQQSFKFEYTDERRSAYWRSVHARNATVVSDAEGGPLAPKKRETPGRQIVFVSPSRQEEEMSLLLPRWLMRKLERGNRS